MHRPFVERVGALGAVRPGERALAGYLVLTFFLLGAGLAVGRGTADALTRVTDGGRIDLVERGGRSWLLAPYLIGWKRAELP